jgi:hypothetical protein
VRLGVGKGRLSFVATVDGAAATGSLLPGWARIAAGSGYSILNDSGDGSAAGGTADLALIEGPLLPRLPTSRRCFIVDDGAPAPVLADRLQQASGAGVLCPDPERVPVLTSAGLPARTITPAIEVWRWRRPVRPAWPQLQIVVATDVQSDALAGLTTLPLPPAHPSDGGLMPYPTLAQAAVLTAVPVRPGPVLTALATGLPVVLPPGALSWLGPLAALRLSAAEIESELRRLAREPAAWFDQIAEGQAALARIAHPSEFLHDLAGLFDQADSTVTCPDREVRP